MVDWKLPDEIYRHDVWRTSNRSQNRKPNHGSWQPTVPAWEKKFCTLVGTIPWRKLVEAKRVMSFYDNVVQWNDSAGEEAFNNAKNRFWAHINGLHCDISLPDPDIYIDEIDWNPNIDPELVLDLDKKPAFSDEDEKDVKPVFVGNSLCYLNQPVVCTGWGDAEEDQNKIANNSSYKLGWGDSADNDVNPWEHSCAQLKGNVECDKAWGNPWDNSWDTKIKGSENLKSGSDGECWGTWDWNCKNRETSRRNMSRYKTSRFHGDVYQTDGWSKNGKGRKRVNFVYDRPPVDKKPLGPKQWNSIQSCGPVSHNRFGEAHHPWNWKPVS